MPSDFSSNPKKLFLIDGLGAVVSAFFLGIVLVKFESVFGIPKQALYLLAAIPIVFGIYDFFCYTRGKHLGGLLKIIAIANLLYCALSIGMAILHKDSVTTLGWTYIIVEVLIILLIAVWELRVAKRLD